MKIVAVTQDQIILKDGVPALVNQVGGYVMTNGEWAVHFDSDTGIGHIEYIDSRPNAALSQADYDAHYSWLETKHQDVVDYEAQQAALLDSSADTGTTTV